MIKESIVWKCECGRKEYSEYPPEECGECWKIGSFLKDSEISDDRDLADEMGEFE